MLARRPPGTFVRGRELPMRSWHVASAPFASNLESFRHGATESPRHAVPIAINALYGPAMGTRVTKDVFTMCHVVLHLLIVAQSCGRMVRPVHPYKPHRHRGDQISPRRQHRHDRQRAAGRRRNTLADRIAHAPGPGHMPMSAAAAAGSLCSSGMSVIVASVSSNTLATDTAFSSAMRTTLVGSTMPASIRSTYVFVAAS